MKKLSPITKGTANELFVASDLMNRGYEVFKALSLNSSCDLIILEKEKTYRIEVKSGFYRKEPSAKQFIKHNKEKFDILAVVYRKKIQYYPQPPTFFELLLLNK